MSHTYTQLLYHLVFSTKQRQRCFMLEHREPLFDYLGGTVRGLGGVSLRVGGWQDHVHLVARIPAKIAVSDFVRDLKANSSTWVQEQLLHNDAFHWQTGYGAFSVSKSGLEKVIAYVDNQETHHSRATFEEEFVALLEKHDLEYDLRYVFD